MGNTPDYEVANRSLAALELVGRHLIVGESRWIPCWCRLWKGWETAVSRIRFGIVGGAGWRSEFFLRIVRELSDRFEVTGMVVRDPEKGRALEGQWDVPTFRDVEELLGSKASDTDFVIVSVPRKAAPGIVRQLAARDMPVLCETPPAETVEGMVELYKVVGREARIQIAEQYPYQPDHAARLEVVRSGKLGEISSAQVQAAHDYHGIVLMRKFLGIGFEDAAIRASTFVSPLVGGPGRDGPPAEEQVVKSTQTIAMFDFGGKIGVYDFTGDQYFSWIRSPRLLVRGDRGEINDMHVRWLQDYRTPLEAQLLRLDAGHGGNLEGFHLKGILCGSEYVYRNPFAPGRLADDEIAIADCFARMADYAAGRSEGFYGLAEACQDHYLGLMMHQAAETGETVRTSPQVWSPLR